MEVDELKSLWMSLDTRLNKQEELKTSLIREMIDAKSDRSLRQLITAEIFSTVVMLIALPFLVFLWRRWDSTHIALHALLSLAFVSYVFYLPLILCRIRLLLKIDFADNLKTNIRHIQRFNKLWQWEKFSIRLWLPALLLLMVWYFIEAKASVVGWVAAACCLAAASIYSYWSYKRVYVKNIAIIRDNLAELEETTE
jgi:amino acid transporter